MSLVLSTLESLKAARSNDELFRISRGLMRLAAPAEVKALVESPAVPSGPFRAWLAAFYANVTRHRPDVTMHRHRLVTHDISFYSAGPGRKRIVIGVCGQAHLLCSPTAVLLQYFPDDEFDVLVLRDPQGANYSMGIFGYANRFPAVVERLRVDLALDGYDDIRCFGVSAGAAPAILAGLMLNGSSIVSLCGRPPSVSPTYGREPGAIEIEERLRTAAPADGRIAAVFGARNEADARNAEGLAALVRLRLVPVDLAEHGIVVPLHKEGKLTMMFRDVGLL
jgi:hypothetical protein